MKAIEEIFHISFQIFFGWKYQLSTESLLKLFRDPLIFPKIAELFSVSNFLLNASSHVLRWKYLTDKIRNAKSIKTWNLGQKYFFEFSCFDTCCQGWYLWLYLLIEFIASSYSLKAWASVIGVILLDPLAVNEILIF